MSPAADEPTRGGPPADSAGVPFAGRAFHENPGAGDDGSAPPRLLEALRRFRAHEVGAAEVVAPDVRAFVERLRRLGLVVAGALADGDR
jgi:hypothetical protein